MTARLMSGLTYDLSDGPIRTEYSRDVDGKQTARLILGEGVNELGISVTLSPAKLRAQLIEAVAELDAEMSHQERLQQLPEVAA
ncbi:hypothetical protein ACN2WE_05475 [Streptomyces sp. cg28]|uniref:hypothetical protein n=1 Tax=Streptomyces sp. cg28 TaxID=3403457 RepID=UPI003B217C23